MLKTITDNALDINNGINVINNNVSATHQVASAIQGKLLSEGLDTQVGFLNKTAEVLSRQPKMSSFVNDPELASAIADALAGIADSGLPPL